MDRRIFSFDSYERRNEFIEQLKIHYPDIVIHKRKYITAVIENGNKYNIKTSYPYYY